MKKAYHILYVAVVVAIFAGFTIVFDTFPRSTFSELEKRDLATFPEFSWDKLWSGRYSEEISTWFSDSEPYRDNFMALSMEFDEAKRVSFSDDNVKITLAAPMADASVADESAQETQEAMENPLADENGKLANAGIIVVGEGENVRALMIYGGDARGGVAYAEAANQYYQTFGGKVKVYSMTIPLATEFYCPDNVKKHSRPQRPTID
ncbi:MAG: DHHW family protein, partial [Muribaculaceae bacterium]|nr:DHHW family protein [Muribaculaceae bacterium]